MYIYIYIYISTSIFHCLPLFHSPIPKVSLTHRCIYPIFPDGLVVFLPSGFQLTIIFCNRVGSILSTLPYQMSFVGVISSNIVSCEFIFSLICSFVFPSSVEILADCLNVCVCVYIYIYIYIYIYTLYKHLEREPG